MTFLPRLLSLLRNLVRRRMVEQDLHEEVNSYVELATAAKIRDGSSPAEARREALMEVGGMEQAREQVRQARMGYFLENRWRDLRFAFRTLSRAPLFSFSVLLVLGLGLGSTLLVFSIVNSLLLQGPPFPQGDRLQMLWQDLPLEKRVSFSPREFQIWRQETRAFASLAALTGTSYTVTGRGEPYLAPALRVTPSFFSTLGTRPFLGRAFSEEEGKPGRERVALVSYAFWRDRLGGSRDVPGTELLLDGESHTIVGVMPERFDFPGRQTSVWVPAVLETPAFQEHLDAHFLRVVGRLRPGVTPEELRAETELLGSRVNAPGDDTVRNFYPVSLQKMILGDLERPLLILLGAAGLLLLIACANVANLMLARAHARRGEMALRSALGASHGRLVGQLLTEAGLLALGGGALGLALAMAGLDLLQLFSATNLPQLAQARVDGWCLLLAATLSAGSAILFGVGPAWHLPANTFEACKGTTRSTTSRRAERTRQLLVFVEVALACVLLVSCGLMLRSFLALLATSPGFQPRNVITAEVYLPKERYADRAAMIDLYQSSLDKLRALPAAGATALATHLPFAGNSWGNSFEVEGHPIAPGDQLNAQIRPVSPGYFSTLGIPLRQGRDFKQTDKEEAPGVAIVNHSFAQRFWPDRDPLGRRIRYAGAWLEIVGISGNIKHAQLEAAPEAEIYVPYPQVPADVIEFVGRGLHYIVRTETPVALAPLLRSSLHTLDPDMVVETRAMETLIAGSVAQPRFRTWLIGIVSGFALLLASLGVYGVIAYLVTQRSREIGIRIALGATYGSVVRLLLGNTLRLAAAGVTAGLLAAFLLSRFLGSILFGIAPHDPLTFTAVPVFLLAVALLSGYLPARRAARIDPALSLRCE